jgi:tetratricopeptide (TPR) repeat protein
VKIKNKKSSKVYSENATNGKVIFKNLKGGEFLIKTESEGYSRKTAKVNLDFNEKDTYKATFKLVPNLVSDKDNSKNIDIMNVFSRSSQNYKLVLEEKKISDLLNKGQGNSIELGLIRSELAMKLLAKSLKTNDSKIFQISYQYAEAGSELAPNESYAWLVYGVLNSEIKSSETARILAEDAFEICLKIDPSNTMAMNYLAEVYYRDGLFKKASTLLEELVVLLNKTPSSQNLALLNLCYIRGSLRESGENFFKILKKQYPDNEFIKIQLAILYNYFNQKKDAIKELNLVIASKSASHEQKKYAENLLYFNK